LNSHDEFPRFVLSTYKLTVVDVGAPTRKETGDEFIEIVPFP